ncbi:MULTISPECIES: hypothetical protein [unclassified Paenibacillus]|uniref:hypothetical protein n=1 Tax=unclassified Paenibacillus TaxID=185978 RepID=UPI00277DF738|nr:MULTISPECIES: hypothetical protein [unclassified Paenibacillus]MDQ0896424.1 hypothetical protein [Paenibacillus sp. V4I7]MDQ0914032.1 hypothetical protein [Paenibacillus sp. V4I5]
MRKIVVVPFIVLITIVMSACNPNLNASNRQLLKAEDISSIQVVGGLPGTKHSPLFQNTDGAGKTTISKIIGWINTSKPISGQTEYGKHGYPMVISIKTDDGKMITVEPAYDCVSQTNVDGSGSKTCTPAKSEIVLRNDSNKIRAESPELYKWINEGWEEEK